MNAGTEAATLHITETINAARIGYYSYRRASIGLRCEALRAG